MTVENTAAPAPAAPAPKTDADYRNDVTKQLNEKLTPAPAAPAPTPKPDIKPEDAPSPTIKLSLQKIAEQNKALREREDKIKPFEEISRVVDPQRLSRSLVARDPLAYLEAGGFKYEDVVDRVMANQPKTGTPKVEEQKAEPEGIVKELQTKLAAMEKERNEEKVGKARADLVQKGLTLVSAENFPLVSRLGEEAVNEAIDVLLDFAAQTGGKYPADTIEANMELALAHVEEKHVKEKQRLAEKYGLTSVSTTHSVKEQVTEAPVKPRGEVNGQTTLSSSSLTAPASSGAAPKTDAEYQAQAAAELRRLFNGG
jgi:hypothetical protein